MTVCFWCKTMTTTSMAQPLLVAQRAAARRPIAVISWDHADSSLEAARRGNRRPLQAGASATSAGAPAGCTLAERRRTDLLCDWISATAPRICGERAEFVECRNETYSLSPAHHGPGRCLLWRGNYRPPTGLHSPARLGPALGLLLRDGRQPHPRRHHGGLRGDEAGGHWRRDLYGGQRRHPARPGEVHEPRVAAAFQARRRRGRAAGLADHAQRRAGLDRQWRTVGQAGAVHAAHRRQRG